MGAADISGLDEFISQWNDSPSRTKKAFLHFVNHLEQKEGVSFEFIARDGLTYSLRAKHVGQSAHPLFVLIDVIEDDPRWLSICFYREMVADPDEKGDMVPEGLLGEDARCFDLEAFDDEDVAYMEVRLDEAWQNSVKN
jgi:hypothetical protein